MADAKETAVKDVTLNKGEVEVIDEDDVLILKKPLSGGAETLTFDFDRVNGYTLLACEKHAKKQDPTITVPSLSLVFQAFVAAAAAGVKYDDILGLCGADFTAACLRAQNFLLQSGR